VLETCWDDGKRDGLKAARVRRVAHDGIPGAARKNEEECSWVNGLPDGETQNGTAACR
jgi:hypothetical protein